MKWIWNRMAFRLPDDWEMLQFSRNPSQGRCVFADRYQYRLELNWMRTESQPDMDRLSSDYLAKLREDGVESVQKVSHLPWGGAYGLEGKRPVTRYGAYFTDGPYLLESVFIGEDGGHADFAADGRILDSFRVLPKDRTSHWRAFGMDWMTSAENFAHCNVAPGLAMAVFNDESQRCTQTFSRRGMLKTWLKSTVGEWLEAKVPSDYSTISLHSENRDGHEVWTLLAKRRRTVLSDWLHGRRHFRASAWICPKDGRLYSVGTQAHGDCAAFPQASLGCCDFRVGGTAP